MIRITILLLFISTIAFGQEWQTNQEKAFLQAKEQNVPVLLVFQGSDWCAPCRKMEKDIWDSQAFKDYAKDHLVLLKADFPRNKENKPSFEIQNQNAKLFEKYNKEGYFPFVVILDSEGNVLKETGYILNETPQDFIALLEQK